MGITRLLKPALFVYECVRILILAAFVALQPAVASALLTSDATVFPVLVYASPSALFPLMAMFLWLDASRYRAYLPLFAAGKCIGIITLLGWSIVTRHLTLIKGFSGGVLAEWVLLSGDLLALAAVILIIKNMDKKTETSALEVE